MSQIQSQNPGSTEIQSALIAGITEGLNKISSVLNLKVGTLNDVVLSPISIDNTEDNKNRIYEAPEGNRLWLSSPSPVIKKNGSEITQSGSRFTIDYVGGSITFPTDSKPSELDSITVSAQYIIAESETISDISSTLSIVKDQSEKYKGNYSDYDALVLAHASAENGDFAIVFSPLAVYAWKDDGWYDTRSIEDLSNYYNKDETNNLLNQKEPSISAKGSATSDDNYYFGGRKTWQNLFTKVRSATLDGLSTASDAVVVASDTILSAIGKLQAQVSKATGRAYLSGTGAPTEETVGEVGQRYVNTSNGEQYVCKFASGGVYTWELQTNGHFIQNENGEKMTHRPNLKFSGKVSVTDDSGANLTYVNVLDEVSADTISKFEDSQVLTQQGGKVAGQTMAYAESIINGDANTFFGGRFYRVASGYAISNAPTTRGAVLEYIPYLDGSSWFLQRCTAIQPTDKTYDSWFRVYDGGTFGAWQKIRCTNGIISSGTDFNSFTSDGTYFKQLYSAGYPNAPNDNAGRLDVATIVSTKDNSCVKQTFTAWTGTTNVTVKTRIGYKGSASSGAWTWSAWS